MIDNSSPPIIAFTAGKGGCGKTTLSVNFANTVWKSDSTVLLIDFDLNNRGSSGFFRNSIPVDGNHLSLTHFLKGEMTVNGRPRPLIEVKPPKFGTSDSSAHFYFLPASSKDEPVWSGSDVADYAKWISELRGRLLDFAEKLEIDCLVLDCFCGIDLLTTAGASVADHTILVNEPDLVTFTGSIVLLEHLNRSFEKLEKKPRMHFVINRLRSNYSVRDLTMLYSNNLQERVGEIVLCHFPYHPRIFDTFGQFPFISDLLPGSLFVKKLQLLTYLLFKGEADDLIQPQVLSWSKRYVNRLYYKSIDTSAVDSGYLVLKFTNFPLMVGLWIASFYLIHTTFTVTPYTAWFIVVFLGVIAVAIVWSSLLDACWLAARLNLSLALFNWNLYRNRPESTSLKDYLKGYLKSFFLSIVPPFIGFLSMALASLSMFLALLFVLVYFIGWACNIAPDPANSFEDRANDIAKNFGGREISFGGARIAPDEFSSFAQSYKNISNAIVVSDDKDKFDIGLDIKELSARNLRYLNFEKCNFSNFGSLHPYPQPITVKKMTWDNVVGGNLGNVNDLDNPAYVFFVNCYFAHSTITFVPGSICLFANCKFYNTQILLAQVPKPTDAKLTVCFGGPTTAPSGLKLPPGTEIVKVIVPPKSDVPPPPNVPLTVAPSALPSGPPTPAPHP